MKLRDLERHLAAHGAHKVGDGGNHTKWRNAEGGRATAVPRHGEIGLGVRASDLQAARHSAAEPQLSGRRTVTVTYRVPGRTESRPFTLKGWDC